MSFHKTKSAQRLFTSLLSSCPKKVRPPCPYFGECGGCDLQDIKYTEQLKLKQAWIEHLLSDFSGTKIQPIIASPQEYKYRNRITLHHDGRAVGYCKKKTHDIIPVRSCCLASDSLNKKLEKLDRSVLKGPRSFSLREDSANMFVQVNQEQNKNLIATVTLLAGNIKSWRVLELYCGAGNLTFSLAENFRRITAVDNDPEAIAIAVQQQKERHLSQGIFLAQAVHDVVFQACQDLKQFDLVVCDPPREGLAHTAILLPRLKPKKIVYVSCNPTSFIDDAKILLQKEYQLTTVVSLDMFPQTKHVELVGVFLKNIIR